MHVPPTAPEISVGPVNPNRKRNIKSPSAQSSDLAITIDVHESPAAVFREAVAEIDVVACPVGIQVAQDCSPRHVTTLITAGIAT